MGCPKAPSLTPVPSGATRGHGQPWSRHCVHRPVCQRGASPRRALSVSRAHQCSPPRWVARSAGMLGARQAQGARGLSGSLRGACGSPASFPVPASRRGWQPRSCSARSRPMPCRVSCRSWRSRRILTMRSTPGGRSLGPGGTSCSRCVQRAQKAVHHWRNAGAWSGRTPGLAGIVGTARTRSAVEHPVRLCSKSAPYT